MIEGHATSMASRRLRLWAVALAWPFWRPSLVLWLLAWSSAAAAQAQTTYTNATGGVIADLSCNLPVGSQLVRTFNVPTSYIVGDVDVGVLLNHTYRSDLRLFLTSPTGTTVSILPWTTNVQSGNNLNDLFDDEAAAAITAHAGNANDPLTPTPPPYSHSFRPANPFNAFDGQDAAGNWTLRICDAVATDTGDFRRADLFITSTSISAAKTSAVISDGVNVADPKALPGATMQYCILLTNNGNAVTAASTDVLMTDPLPPNVTFVPGSMRSGSSCAAATTIEDDDNVGADESDPFGMAYSAATVTGRAATLAANGTFAMSFQVTIN
jgi:uncharacterized repeat protein (TIGR01451 family)